MTTMIRTEAPLAPARRFHLGLGVGMVLLPLLAGCSTDDEVQPPVALPGASSSAPTGPTTAPDDPSSSSSQGATPSPSSSGNAEEASPTPAGPAAWERPATRFDKDPAVQGLYAFYAAVSEAVNAQNLELPALVQASSSQQQEYNQALREEFGAVAPGPVPVVALGVRVADADTRIVTYCVINNGWTVNKKTGKPRAAREVIAARGNMQRAGSRWVLDGGELAAERLCEGVDLP